MVYVECFFADGNTIATGFNGTLLEAQQYYLGDHFNLGLIQDDMQECVRVIEI